MKVKIRIDNNGRPFETVIEASTHAALFDQFRKVATSQLPFWQRPVAGALSDQAFMKHAIDSHNSRTSAKEAVPETIEDFLAFGERHGYVTRL